MVEAAPVKDKHHLGLDLGQMYVSAAIMKDGEVFSSVYHSAGISTPSAIYLYGQGNDLYGH